MKWKKLAAGLMLFILAGCSTEYHVDFFSMDTMMRITVQGEQPEEVAQQAVARVNELNDLLSRTSSQSELYRINHGEESDGSADRYIALALAMAQQTQGYFDPTVAALSDLWGIGTEQARVPTAQEIQEVMLHVGVQNVKMSQDTHLESMENGVQIDFGGIAKGIAADEAAAILRAHDSEGLIVLGGNIYAVGSNKGKDWTIGIANPDNSTDYLVKLALQDVSAVTTGDYERYFIQDGVRYHHVFDPKTGYPAQTDLRSVTVLGKESTACDALSTALFVMGFQKAVTYCAQNEIAAVFITQDKQIFRTPQVDAICQYTFVGKEEGYIDAGQTEPLS